MFDLQKFGEGISSLRKNKDMTQFELADLIGISRQAISRYECGESFPDISVLSRMAEIFGISLGELISQGDPTQAEAAILEAAASEKINEMPDEIYGILGISKDLVNIAPLLKASTLDIIASKLSVHGIDISALVSLANYLNSSSFDALVKNANFDALDPALLEKLMPLLDNQAKEIIFQKILDGEIDYHLISAMLPYAEYLVQHVEAAVVYGVLDEGALKILNEYIWNK